MPKLHILSGKRQGDVIDVQAGSQPLVIGNRKSAQISIRDPWVSWDHASLSFDGQTFVLEDLNSSNGTYVNQKRVQKVPLNDQDTMWFGKTKCRFFLNDATAPAASTNIGKASSAGPSPEALTAAVSAATGPLIKQLGELQGDKARLEAEVQGKDTLIAQLQAAGGGGSPADAAELQAATARAAELEAELARQKGFVDQLQQASMEEVGALESRIAELSAAAPPAGDGAGSAADAEK
ncbi:MAG: FHA domain-containing protein, partial [Planctomycetota bacterium]